MQYTFTKENFNADQLTAQIRLSTITVALDYISAEGDQLHIFFKATLSTSEETTLTGIVTAHTPNQVMVIPSPVKISNKEDNDGNPVFAVRKSYVDRSTSLTSPNYCNRQTWYGDVTKVVDEVLTTSDNIMYSSERAITKVGWGHDWINWKLIPNNARNSQPDLKVVVKKNSTVVPAGQYSVDHALGRVTFITANNELDVVTVSYAYANTSTVDMQAKDGKILLVDYIEVQVSEGIVIPDNCYLLFQSIYHGPAVPSLGIPANTDVVVGAFEYWGAHDFVGESTQGYTLQPFMGLTKPVVVMPWSYLTGYTMKTPADTTTDIFRNEFNKLRMRLVDANNGPDPILTSGEIGSATIYSRVEPSFDV